MPDRDSLGTRMKTYYEEVPKFRLYKRTPVAIRIDGKAFHTFTRDFKKPFDEVLIKYSSISVFLGVIWPCFLAISQFITE